MGEGQGGGEQLRENPTPHPNPPPQGGREPNSRRPGENAVRGLTLEDLLPLGDYANQRRDFFAAHCRYVDRYRRVRIGPRLALQFANRLTLWFHVQELLRVARLADPEHIQQELPLYNPLLPRRDCLQAAL